jgi:hypothetical protein
VSTPVIQAANGGSQPAAAIPRASLERGYFQIGSDEPYLNGWTSSKLRVFFALRDESRGNPDFPLPPEFLARSVGGIHPSDVRRLTAELIREGLVQRTAARDDRRPTFAVRPLSRDSRRVKVPSAVREDFWSVLPRCAHEMHRAILLWGSAPAASLGERVGLSARAAQLGYRLLHVLGAIDDDGRPTPWGSAFDAVLSHPEVVAARAHRSVVPLRNLSGRRAGSELAPATKANQVPQFSEPNANQPPQTSEPDTAGTTNPLPPQQRPHLMEIPRSRLTRSFPTSDPAPLDPGERRNDKASSDQPDAFQQLAEIVERDFARVHGQWLFRAHVLRTFARLLERGLTIAELEKFGRAAPHFPNLPTVHRGSPFDAAFSDARLSPWLAKHRRRPEPSRPVRDAPPDVNPTPPPPDCLARLRALGIIRDSARRPKPNGDLASSGVQRARSGDVSG